MESPVRICLGAVLVLNLLLLRGSIVNGNVLPQDSTATTIKDDKTTKYARVNNTPWVTRNKPKSPDVAQNELNPKETVSDEHTEKNAKYKDRGRVRFNSRKGTQNPLRRVSSSTEASTLVIVTPTAEVKKPAQIIDSMRVYKKKKLPVIASSSSAPLSINRTETELQSEEEDEFEDEQEDKESFEKFTSSKFHENFYNIPGFKEGDFSRDSERTENKAKQAYSSQSFSTYSSFFPKETYGSKDDPYKSNNFFDFDSELTTPKNDYFDNKFREISSSIIKNLATIKAKSPPQNGTNVQVIKENIGLEKSSNGTPNNKSTVIIKNTKEIRLLDNEGAGSANRELSDVHGTRIYYEMSVLSTETYAINQENDDDCDNDTLPSDSTHSTSSEQELALISKPPPPTKPTILSVDNIESQKRSVSVSQPQSIFSTLSPEFLQISTGIPLFNPASSIPFSTQNTVSSTDKSRIFSSSFNRNRSYSKRLNLNGLKDSPNSVTFSSDHTNNSGVRPTRKFHYTTPKTKPIWMAPRRNITRTTYTYPTKMTHPSTIYSEHFSIKEKLPTPKIRPFNRTMLTTVSSEIDPVLQSDISGTKKIVHSQSISDNTIPSLWKRGSTKFSSSTATSAETESGISDMEIPPTLTAWALASLRSPPSLASPVANTTSSTQKSDDENELQNVSEITDKRETTTSSTVPTTQNTISNEVVSKKIIEMNQNKLPWRPAMIPTSSDSDAQNEAIPIQNEAKERLPAESNISVKNSTQLVTSTESMKTETQPTKYISNDTKFWIPVASNSLTTEEQQDTIPPVDATKSTGFESITKLPAGITTPQDDTVDYTENNAVTEKIKLPATADFEITTIRFSYVPTEEVTEEVETEMVPESTTTSEWHPVFPTRTKTTTIKDGPVTTYRPKYLTTAQSEEITTVIIDTTPQLEVSSQVVENITEVLPKTTQTFEETTTEMTTTEQVTTVPTTTEKIIATTETLVPVTEEITTIVVEVVTEINTERESSKTTTAQALTTESWETDSNSEENSGSNEVITQEVTKLTSTTTTTTTKESSATEPVTTESEMKTTEEIFTESTRELSTEQKAEIIETTIKQETTTESTTDMGTKSINDLEDLTSYSGEVTTEASSRVLEESGTGAAIAIAVSTIGVIALILLVGLLLVVRRRGRRGVYAQRCTPVSLDAYSLDSVSVGHRKGNQRLRASKRSYGNPAYDDEVTSHPMQYAALANFALDIDSITAEFAEIPSVTVRPDEVPPGCEDKNRYSNVLPLPETRVPLKRIGNDPTTEYINANFITGPGNIRNYYIACQAPLANTVGDFWRMIWEQNSRVIVMLTEYMENGVDKCYEYLPPSEISDNKRTFGDYQVILKKREQRDKYAVSSVQLINLTSRTWREVTHLWYFWPAKGVPDDYDSIIDFLSEMRSYMKISQTAKEYDEEGVEVIYGDQNRSSFGNLSKLREDSGSGNGVNVYSPAKAEENMRRGGATNGTLGRMKAASEIEGVRACVVVCASGAGRSAALVACDVCARALAAGRVDVPRVVRELRAQRPHSLSNRHHYIFLYKVLSEYGNKLMGGVDTI